MEDGEKGGKKKDGKGKGAGGGFPGQGPPNGKSFQAPPGNMPPDGYQGKKK
jgi:hypothetical protein